jgi:dephospho-CoA kinase
VIVEDIPLLVESQMAPMFPLVVVVNADPEVQVRRLIEYRGFTEADARARIAAQATEEQRREVADVWLDNSGSEGQLVELARDLWYQRILPFAHNATRTPTAHPSTPVPADPTWAQQAGRIINRLNTACGHRAQRIDHIGSTAVPGMDAKDVIDIQITVAALEVADETGRRCCGRATRVNSITTDVPKPDARSVDGRFDTIVIGVVAQALSPRQTGRPTNIHIRVAGWPNQQFALVFVDWLTASPAVQSEYLAVKRAAGHHDVSGYAQAKEPWFLDSTGAHGPGRTPPTGGRDRSGGLCRHRR